MGSELNPRVKETYYNKAVLSYCDTNTIGLPLEKYQEPFFFLMDKDGKAKMVFVPDKAVPEMTDMYLTYIRERFLN